MNQYEFSCGCKFDILNEDPLHLDIDFDNINMDCPRTWDTLALGKTKGVFQLEEWLGRNWCRKIKPNNLEHLGALGALLRPGCTKAKDEKGISTTEHYSLRKNGQEKVISFHPAIEHILAPTYGVMVYQEQAMQIAQTVAGFNLIQADTLRKAIGKKKADVMSEVKTMFIEGCKKVGILTEKEAEDLFGLIRESQKYSFNKCLSPNTIVETEFGFKTLDDVKIGDKVNSPSGFVEVVDKIEQGIQEIYEVVLSNGNKIECTLEHKFLCDDGVVRPLFEIAQQNFSIVCEE